MFGINNPKITVVSLTFHDTGGFSDQVLRSYETKVDRYSVDILNESIRSVERGTGSVELTPVGLRDAVGNAITVSTRPTSFVGIENGWSENRLRFVLIVEVENNFDAPTMLYYFQGYTDHKGVSPNGHIDPNMIMVINSYLAVKKVNVTTPTGNLLANRVTQASNIINFSKDDVSAGFSTARPSDLFSTMQMAAFSGGLGIDSVDAYDTRTMPIMNDPVVSVKKNANPTDYLSTIVNAYTLGVSKAESTTHSEGMRGSTTSVENSIDMSKEPLLSNNPFIRALGSLAGHPGNIVRFTMNNLAEIDQYVGGKINYIDGTKALQASMGYNNYESWSTQTREVVASTIIFNALTSIMIEMFIMNLSLISTNATINGVPHTTIVNANSPETFNLPRMLNLLISRLENEVLWGLTFNNQDTYRIEVSIDLYGASNINISFNNEPFTPFQRATFADSLFQPIVTSSKFQNESITKDIETLVGQLDLGVYTHDMYMPNPAGNTYQSPQRFNPQADLTLPQSYNDKYI